MRPGVVHMAVRDAPAPLNLFGALCVGSSLFTADHLDRLETAWLLLTCHRCPVLHACAQDRDRWRHARPYDWAQFSGVWAGQAYAKGRPASRQIGALP